MPSSDYRFHGEEVGYADMAEAPRREKESNAKAVGVVIVVSLVLLALAGLLIFGSQPALTPEQIISRDDYEGQQPARHIFNLYSLKQAELKRDTELANKSAKIAKASISANPTKTSELPASAVASKVESSSAPQPAAEPAYVKSELSRESVPVISTVEPEVSPQPEPTVTVLPVYSIKGNQTNMRALPTTDAPILKTLNKGQTVTVFDETGEWVQVAANDGSGISGYVHQSLLESPGE